MPVLCKAIAKRYRLLRLTHHERDGGAHYTSTLRGLFDCARDVYNTTSTITEEKNYQILPLLLKTVSALSTDKCPSRRKY